MEGKFRDAMEIAKLLEDSEAEIMRAILKEQEEEEEEKYKAEEVSNKLKVSENNPREAENNLENVENNSKEEEDNSENINATLSPSKRSLPESGDNQVTQPKRTRNESESKLNEMKTLLKRVGRIEEVKSPLEAWSLLLPDALIEKIVQHTNEEFHRRSLQPSQNAYQRDQKTNLKELKALIGLLYFNGVQKVGHINLDELWSNKFGSTLYKVTMCQWRFAILLPSLKFEARKNSEEPTADVLFSPIKQFWQEFIENCRRHRALDVSTYNNPFFDEETDDDTQSSVDMAINLENIRRTFTTHRVTQRWPMKVFFRILDQAAFNASIFYNFNLQNEKLNLREFLKVLAYALIEPYLRFRLEQPMIKRSLKTSIRQVLGVETDLFEVRKLADDPVPVTKRCLVCPRKIDRKTKITCSMCSRPICNDHKHHVCVDCYDTWT